MPTYDTTSEAPATKPAIAPAYPRHSVSGSREQTNPLRSLTVQSAVSYMESAQRGDFLDLQWLYYFVEQTEAVLFALQERRYGRLAEMDWEVKIIPRHRRRASFDETLAQEQAAALAENYDRIDNLKDAIEHLASATFRLYAHLNIHRDPAGDVKHLEPLDQWNFLRAGMFGPWYYNPGATINHYSSLPAENKLQPADFIIRTVQRHIDRPALIKYIRKNLADKDWTAFVEIYGVPTPALVMPPNATEAQKSQYESAASALAKGNAVALPNGTTVEFPDGPRGSSPFREYLQWCDEQMVLIGTGGMLSMLSMPQGIGSGSSDVHDAAFQSLAAAEALRISEIFQAQLDKPTLAQKFPGKPVLAYFEICAHDSEDPGIVLDHAVKAKTAGFSTDPSEISERTGYTLTAAPAPVSPFPPPASAASESAAEDEEPEESAANEIAEEDSTSLNTARVPSPVAAAAKAVDLPVAAAAKAVDLPVAAAAKAVDLPVAAAAKAVALRAANAKLAATGAQQTAQAQDEIMADWFARFEELARQAKTEEEFLAAAQTMVDAMPAQLLTHENVARLAAPMEGAIGAAIVNTIATRKESPK